MPNSSLKGKSPSGSTFLGKIINKNEKSLQDKITSIFIIFYGLSLKQIEQTSLEGKSPILLYNELILLEEKIFCPQDVCILVLLVNQQTRKSVMPS